MPQHKGAGGFIPADCTAAIQGHSKGLCGAFGNANALPLRIRLSRLRKNCYTKLVNWGEKLDSDPSLGGATKTS